MIRHRKSSSLDVGSSPAYPRATGLVPSPIFGISRNQAGRGGSAMSARSDDNVVTGSTRSFHSITRPNHAEHRGTVSTTSIPGAWSSQQDVTALPRLDGVPVSPRVEAGSMKLPKRALRPSREVPPPSWKGDSQGIFRAKPDGRLAPQARVGSDGADSGLSSYAEVEPRVPDCGLDEHKNGPGLRMSLVHRVGGDGTIRDAFKTHRARPADQNLNFAQRTFAPLLPQVRSGAGNAFTKAVASGREDGTDSMGGSIAAGAESVPSRHSDGFGLGLGLGTTVPVASSSSWTVPHYALDEANALGSEINLRDLEEIMREANESVGEQPAQERNDVVYELASDVPPQSSRSWQQSETPVSTFDPGSQGMYPHCGVGEVAPWSVGGLEQEDPTRGDIVDDTSAVELIQTTPRKGHATEHYSAFPTPPSESGRPFSGGFHGPAGLAEAVAHLSPRPMHRPGRDDGTYWEEYDSLLNEMLDPGMDADRDDRVEDTPIGTQVASSPASQVCGGSRGSQVRSGHHGGWTSRMDGDPADGTAESSEVTAQPMTPESKSDSDVLVRRHDRSTPAKGFATPNLRFAALLISRYLTFGRVLFSPVHSDASETAAAGVEGSGGGREGPCRVLVIDGLGRDFSFYLALTYPGADVFALSPTPVSSSSSFDPATGLSSPSAFPPPPNHRLVYHRHLPSRLPFPANHFMGVILRFPPVMAASSFKTVLSECKRVLNPGGYVEYVAIDADLANMGERGRAGVRMVKMDVCERVAGAEMRPVGDDVVRGLGAVGMESIRMCCVGVPVVPVAEGGGGGLSCQVGGDMSCPAGDDLVVEDGMPAQLQSVDAGTGAGGGPSTPASARPMGSGIHYPLPQDDSRVSEMAARVGRWWYWNSYERVGGSGRRDRADGSDSDAGWAVTVPDVSGGGVEGDVANRMAKLDPSTPALFEHPPFLDECRALGTAMRVVVCVARKGRVGAVRPWSC